MSQTSRNRYILALTTAIVLAVVFAATAIFYYVQKADYERYIEMANRRSFSQLTASLSSIDSNLKKMQYAYNGPTYTTITANIWRESEVAKYALATMPLENAQLERFEKFISQAGDYAFSLMKKAAGGATTGDEDKASLESLSATASQLALQMSGLQERLDADDAYIQMRPSQLRMSQQPQGVSVSQEFSQTEEEFPEYSSLIYDGPFSDHVHSLEPKMLEGVYEVNKEKALEVATQFLSGNESLAFSHESNGLIAYYCFTYDEAGTIEVSKQGGIVLSLCDNRTLKTGKLNTEQAVEAAKCFLEERGYEGMKTSYYSVFENIVTVNFAATADDVILYPDLIKVGIALDDGTVVRFDAAGYIMNHHQRELPEPAITRDAAWADIPESMEVVSEHTALIPTSGKNEVLCYEFVCKDAQGRNVIIYINAQTGLQENIFLLIENENGVLTI